MNKDKLPELLYSAIEDLGGKSTIVEVCKYFWEHYENELKESEDLLYTWQYDIRWAATKLRKDNRMIDASISPRGIWEIEYVEVRLLK